MSNNTIPYCPLMSAGGSMPVICAQESCAWYMKGAKSCSVYIMAHKAALEIKNQNKEIDK